MNDRPTFLDLSTSHALARQGYAVLDYRVAEPTLRALDELQVDLYSRSGLDVTKRFVPSMLVRDPTLRAHAWDEVRRLTSGELEPLFAARTVEVAGGSFVAKPPGSAGARQPHQDPSVFDERRVPTLSLWIPLMDATIENGTIRMLPGSHLMGNTIRPPDVDSLDSAVSEAALAESLPLEVERGGVVVIDGAVVHHSAPNDSAQQRVAVICALRPAGHDFLYVRSDGGAPSGTAEVVAAGAELYRSGDLTMPDLSGMSVVGRAPYRPASLQDLRTSQAAARSR